MYEAMGDFAGCTEAYVTWFKLEETGRSIGSFQAHTVPIVNLHREAGATKIWPSRRGCAPKYRPMHPRPGDAGPVAESGHATGSEDGSGSELGSAADPEEREADEGAFEGIDDLLEQIMDAADAEVVPAARAAAEQEAMGAPEDERCAIAQRLAAADPIAAGSADDPPGAAAPRAGATVTFHVSTAGSISYYPSKGAFEAVCLNKAHGRCVLTRTARAKRDRAGRMVKGGRPVGWMAAWLLAGEDQPDKESHWLAENFRRPFAERAELRRQIGGLPSGRLLLAQERPCVEGEGPEPEDLCDYLPPHCREA